MPIVAAVVLTGCIILTLLILRGRYGNREAPPEPDPEIAEALERLRGSLRRPATVIAGATVVALALIAILVRNPSRWAVLLLALAVLVACVAAFLVAERRRRNRGG